jgi:hypothetical protein
VIWLSAFGTSFLILLIIPLIVSLFLIHIVLLLHFSHGIDLRLNDHVTIWSSRQSTNGRGLVSLSPRSSPLESFQLFTYSPSNCRRNRNVVRMHPSHWKAILLFAKKQSGVVIWLPAFGTSLLVLLHKISRWHYPCDYR